MLKATKVIKSAIYGRIRTRNKTTFSRLHGERKWKDRIVKPKVSKKDKCSRVELWKDGKHKTFLVHRLVANAFLDKLLDTDMTVNHKDGNRLNNKVENLEWLSRADNIRHAFDTGLMGSSIKVKLISKIDGSITTCKSMAECSKKIGKNKGYISEKVKKNIYEDDRFTWAVV